jgi:16S rRNA A1518/A1519 N6-dimethyltransferase RsmA/KsgA/DIM1 with predicted DNA glycosylase/AP lyase activity
LEQVNLLVSVLEGRQLLNENTVFIEYGAGKGHLSSELANKLKF